MHSVTQLWHIWKISIKIKSLNTKQCPAGLSPRIIWQIICCWIKISHIGKSQYWEKKVSLIAFRQVLTKILPAACIQLHNYDLFEKAQLKLSPLIQNSVQQDYVPESYTRHLPSYQKCHKIVAPTRCGLSPLPLNLNG